jgi:hypothetical protein
MFSLLAKLLSHPVVFKYLLAYAKKTPYQHIMSPDGNETYMERYWIFNPYPATGKRRRFGWFPLSIRIHKILVPDGDRHLHDHPWNARTFILYGTYTEERKEGIYLRSSGTTATLKFGEYHRITRVSPQGVYTLFVTGKYRGTWGFLVNGAKIKYRKYLEDRGLWTPK